MVGNYAEVERKMKKTLEVLASDLAAIRVGRATPAILDKLTVDYYGAPTPIAQMAAISIPEARILQISPWDASTLKLIEKAIQASDIGINPQNDGKIIRLIFPSLTEDRRREIAKGLNKTSEQSKIAIRAVRRDAIEKFKDQKKKSEITEDDLKVIEKDIQDMTDKFCKEIDVMIADKEKEIMAV